MTSSSPSLCRLAWQTSSDVLTQLKGCGPLQGSLKGSTAVEPVSRERGCWSWRTHRKTALELLPPHLGTSNVPWMNSLSPRFCPQAWPCSLFCRGGSGGVEGCPCATLLCASGSHTSLPHWFPQSLSESVTLLGKSHFPGLSVTNTSNQNTSILLLPARPQGGQEAT